MDKMINKIDQQSYILKLERCIRTLPAKPPEKWDDKTFEYAMKLASIIIKRLRPFQTEPN